MTVSLRLHKLLNPGRRPWHVPINRPTVSPKARQPKADFELVFDVDSSGGLVIRPAAKARAA